GAPPARRGRLGPAARSPATKHARTASWIAPGVVGTRRPLVRVPDLPAGRQVQFLALDGFVFLWRDLDNDGRIVEAAGRVGRKADRHDARGHRLLVDLQQLDPKVVRIGALKAVDGPEARLDLVMSPSQSGGLLHHLLGVSNCPCSKTSSRSGWSGRF